MIGFDSVPLCRHAQRTTQQIKDQCDEWGVSYYTKRDKHLHAAVVVGRFFLVAHWVHLSVSRFEVAVEDYIGPHIPIFVSRTNYTDAEEVIYHNAGGMTPRYVRGLEPFYAVLPAFVLSEDWGPSRLWRWCPAVRVVNSVLRDVLIKEEESGGWPKNKRGRLLIPKRTGSAGLLRPQESGSGWARLIPGDQSNIRISRQR